MNITKAAILTLENNLLEAIKSSDISFLSRVLSESLLFIAPNGAIITKDIDLASHRSGEMVVEEIHSTIENINIIEDTAIVVVVYDTKGMMLGNPIEGKFRYIRIWKQFQDGLKVIGGSCCKL